MTCVLNFVYSDFTMYDDIFMLGDGFQMGLFNLLLGEGILGGVREETLWYLPERCMMFEPRIMVLVFEEIGVSLIL